MKTFILSLLFIVASASAQAQTPGDLFRYFKGAKDAEYVHLGKLAFALMRPFVKGHDDADTRMAMRCIRSMKALDLDDCTDEVKHKFAQMAKNLKTNGYEELVRSNEKGGRALILMRQKKNVIRELLILSAGDDDCSMVQFKGKIKPDDVEKLMKDNK